MVKRDHLEEKMVIAILVWLNQRGLYKIRLVTALPAVIVGAALVAPGLAAQGRGGARGAGERGGTKAGVRVDDRERSSRPFRDGYDPASGYWLSGYPYSDDGHDYGYPESAAPGSTPDSAQTSEGPAQQPAVPTIPVEPLLLELRDGQWVRVPTGSRIALLQSASPDGAQASSARPRINEPSEVAPPAPELPPAVIVFRDGRMEEVRKYMIQGTDLYTSSDYWRTGAWTRKIRLADLNIPASMKVNKERGTKFNLPSGPNEVVVRF
jgi:hypothetical protein